MRSADAVDAAVEAVDALRASSADDADAAAQPLLRALVDAVALHVALDKAEQPSARRALPLDHLDPSALLPSNALGAELEWMQLPLYEVVLASQQAASLRYVEAMASISAVDGLPDVDGDASFDGADDAVGRSFRGLELDDADMLHETDVERAREERAKDSAAFRELYMGILTEEAAADLEGIRQSGKMDEDGLSMLIDGLEAGADTFSPDEQKLALESYRGERSWWARQRRRRELTEAASETQGGGVPEERAADDESEVLARARELEREVCDAGLLPK